MRNNIHLRYFYSNSIDPEKKQFMLLSVEYIALNYHFFMKKAQKSDDFYNFCIFTKSGQTTQIRWVFSNLKQFPSISLNLTFK